MRVPKFILRELPNVDLNMYILQERKEKELMNKEKRTK
jgi:hypothetical protein